jgi:cation diffusion facilitator family transporter
MRFQSRRAYAFLSVAAALVTMALKFGAFVLTGSVGILSDALESLVNLVAALVAVWALTLAARPADETHAYGHSKAEYFSSGMEGALIALAAALIALEAVPRLLHPRPIEQAGLGLFIAGAGAAINGSVAFVLWRAGARLRSIALRADARHLLTDVWTTAGVLFGVGVVALTGWLVLDPLIAVLVAVNILWTGWRLLHQSGLGLLDTALSAEDQRAMAGVLEAFRARGVDFHAVRTRQAAARRFVSLHVLVPGTWTVQRGQDLAEEVEFALHHALPDTTVFTHLEPRDDPTAYADTGLDRAVGADVPDLPDRTPS